MYSDGATRAHACKPVVYRSFEIADMFCGDFVECGSDEAWRDDSRLSGRSLREACMHMRSPPLFRCTSVMRTRAPRGFHVTIAPVLTPAYASAACRPLGGAGRTSAAASCAGVLPGERDPTLSPRVERSVHRCVHRSVELRARFASACRCADDVDVQTKMQIRRALSRYCNCRSRGVTKLTE